MSALNSLQIHLLGDARDNAICRVARAWVGDPAKASR